MSIQAQLEAAVAELKATLTPKQVAKVLEVIRLCIEADHRPIRDDQQEMAS